MKTPLQRVLGLLSIVIIVALVGGGHVDARPVVTLILDPDIRVITVGSDLSEIQLIARVSEEFNVEYLWEITGPGELAGEKTGQGVLYIPLEKIETNAAQVDIAIEVTDENGEKAKQTVTFTLVPPEVPPTPTPSPTPTPVPPVRIHDMTLKDDQGTIMNPIYEVQSGGTITIAVDISGPLDRNIGVDCTAIRGEVVLDQDELIYTAPEKPGAKDMVTVKAIDSDTGKIIVQKIIKIRILETSR